MRMTLSRGWSKELFGTLVNIDMFRTRETVNYAGSGIEQRRRQVKTKAAKFKTGTWYLRDLVRDKRNVAGNSGHWAKPSADRRRIVVSKLDFNSNTC